MVKSHDHQSGTKMLLHRHLLEDTFRQDVSDRCTKIINKRLNIENIGAIVGNKSVQRTFALNLRTYLLITRFVFNFLTQCIVTLF